MLPLGDDNSNRRIFPFVTYLILIVNIIVFLLELQGGDAFVEAWAFVPSRFAANPGREIVNVFTSMFMHAGWMHLGSNMLYLLIFGDNIENRFGHGRYLFFYLLSGVAATALQTFFTLGSNLPIVGASGAIAGILGAYIVLFPTRRVIVLFIFRLAYLPAIIVIGVWFILQLLNGVGSFGAETQTGGIAYMAHIGGFVAGLVLTLFFR